MLPNPTVADAVFDSRRPFDAWSRSGGCDFQRMPGPAPGDGMGGASTSFSFVMLLLECHSFSSIDFCS
jgi:hypothetical protein